MSRRRTAQEELDLLSRPSSELEQLRNPLAAGRPRPAQAPWPYSARQEQLRHEAAFGKRPRAKSRYLGSRRSMPAGLDREILDAVEGVDRYGRVDPSLIEIKLDASGRPRGLQRGDGSPLHPGLLQRQEEEGDETR